MRKPATSIARTGEADIKAQSIRATGRPLWRRFLRALAWLLFIATMAVFVFVAWNRIDEPPTEAARLHATETRRMVADSDNAWLAFAGLGAAPGGDPIALGRRRVEAYRARFEQFPGRPADANEQELFTDVVTAVKPEAGAVDGDALCPERDTDCIEWAHSHSRVLVHLRNANAVLLRRFEVLSHLPDWQMLYPASADAPRLDTFIPRLYLNLLALGLAPDESTTGSPRDAAALVRLADTAEFWRRVRSQPQDLDTILESGRQLETAYWIFSAWLDHADIKQIEANMESVNRVVQPLPTPVDWSVAMAAEYQSFAHTMAQELPGPVAALGRCVSGSAKGGCLRYLAMNATYLPQATLNLRAGQLAAIQQILESSPTDLARVEQEAGAAIQATFPLPDDGWLLLRQTSYNFSGRILAAMAVPTFDWGRREHDREALRRLVVLKWGARAEGVHADEMPQYLRVLDSSFNNPLTGQPFNWDRQQHVLHFSPLSENYWKRKRVEVSYTDP
ncbi:MAG: hypothetical protein R3F08_05960 [Dokdonella sp.]|nr:hypothetical protein [Dokdonella sp.]MCB1573144.1 hypothetical protein [Xanthomonadales bacterium]MCB1578752.1 hypothetical protein [Xanthomonadales bacterium]